MKGEMGKHLRVAHLTFRDGRLLLLLEREARRALREELRLEPVRGCQCPRGHGGRGWWGGLVGRGPVHQEVDDLPARQGGGEKG